MGIALAIATAWIALTLAWRRLRRVRGRLSPSAARLLASLRREPETTRAAFAVSSTTADTWEGQLAREVADAGSSDARASAIDTCLADLEATFEGSHGWDRAVPRIALLGGVLAASVCVIRGGIIQALVSAGVGAAAAALGAALTRRARTLEQIQRQRADDLATLFAGGAGGKYVRAGFRSTGHGPGLDRRAGRR